jgi:hypothetical protein
MSTPQSHVSRNVLQVCCCVQFGCKGTVETVTSEWYVAVGRKRAKGQFPYT